MLLRLLEVIKRNTVRSVLMAKNLYSYTVSAAEIAGAGECCYTLLASEALAITRSDKLSGQGQGRNPSDRKSAIA
jgi:hypothetical protein